MLRKRGWSTSKEGLEYFETKEGLEYFGRGVGVVLVVVSAAAAGAAELMSRSMVAVADNSDTLLVRFKSALVASQSWCFCFCDARLAISAGINLIGKVRSMRKSPLDKSNHLLQGKMECAPSGVSTSMWSRYHAGANPLLSCHTLIYHST